MKPEILVVDDDEGICELLRAAFEQGGYGVAVARDGQEGIKAFFARQPKLVVLDIMMPRMNGWEVLERIREVSEAPVIILTALSREPDAVRGLRSGADDYIAKPIRLTELVARAEVALRRASLHPATEEEYRDALLHVDFLRHQVYLDSNPVELSPLEFRLLAALVRNADRVLSVDRLLDLCWGCGEGGPENVRVYIGYLRRKLENNGRTPRLIETVREFGYRYRPPARETGAASWPLSSTRYVPLRNQVGV